MENSLSERYQQLVSTLLTLLEARNPYNLDHCRLVATYCDKVSRRLGLEPARRQALTKAAEVHTLGVHLQMEEKKTQQSLPITQLGLRSGRETPIHERESEIFKAVLGDVPGFELSIPLLQQRHEFYDGSGSLLGLSGENILLEARILAAVDAFVDLATPKAHRPPESTREVLTRLRQLSGRQFDPVVVDALLAVLQDEEGQWGALARAQQFENSRGHHYLGLGHFYGQIQETAWALRSYASAERVAVSTDNLDLELEAVAGQFLVYVNQGSLEQARQSLQRYRKRSHLSNRAQTMAHLYWGLLQWLEELGPEGGRVGETGRQILEAVIARCREQKEVVVLTSALAFQSTMLLFQKGPADAEHLECLQQFLDLVSRHDVFDVVERYRPQTVPLLLNGVVKNYHASLCRNLLTRLGEPCQDALYERLHQLPPVQWMKVLLGSDRCEPADGAATTALPSEQTMVVFLTGPLRVEMGDEVFGADEFSTQKAARLFALVASRRGGVNDEVLLDAFWPDVPAERGRNSLRNCLHNVRQTLKKHLGDKGAVERCRKTGNIRMHCAYQTDCELFQSNLRQAQELSKQRQWEPALESARRATLQLRGEYMQGAEDEFVEAPRAHFMDQRLRALLLQGRLELELRDGEACEMTAAQVLQLDDLSEEAHGLRFQALALQQRYAEMTKFYARSQDHFRRELGIVPRSIIAAYEACARDPI
ncbi:hypothetical protein IV102_29740 [bacterium]|nr:hypothetical protein [bacterium]